MGFLPGQIAPAAPIFCNRAMSFFVQVDCGCAYPDGDGVISLSFQVGMKGTSSSLEPVRARAGGLSEALFSSVLGFVAAVRLELSFLPTLTRHWRPGVS